jgi:hypothetical protein
MQSDFHGGPSCRFDFSRNSLTAQEVQRGASSNSSIGRIANDRPHAKITVRNLAIEILHNYCSGRDGLLLVPPLQRTLHHVITDVVHPVNL